MSIISSTLRGLTFWEHVGGVGSSSGTLEICGLCGRLATCVIVAKQDGERAHREKMCRRLGNRKKGVSKGGGSGPIIRARVDGLIRLATLEDGNNFAFSIYFVSKKYEFGGVGVSSIFWREYS